MPAKIESQGISSRSTEYLRDCSSDAPISVFGGSTQSVPQGSSGEKVNSGEMRLPRKPGGIPETNPQPAEDRSISYGGFSRADHLEAGHKELWRSEGMTLGG